MARLYLRLAGASDDADADPSLPANYLRILASQTLTKLGDRIANPKSTIAWLLESLGAPVIFTGIIVPLRESGALLPQAAIAGFVRRHPHRKGIWTIASLIQGLAILGIAATAFTLTGAPAGWTIVALLAAFSLARGFCSLVGKDILGKTIPKGSRGKLQGWAGSASGIISIGTGASLIYAGSQLTKGNHSDAYGWLLAMAGAFWLLASLIYSRIHEPPGEYESTGGDRKPGSGLALLRSDRVFRQFVAVRALAIGSGLSAPFIIALAHRNLGGGALWLGVFTIVDGLASAVSGPVWGRLADNSSRAVLRTSLLATGALLLFVAIASQNLLTTQSEWLFPLAVFLLGIVHSGVRIGRKTYVVDLAEGNQRTAYVAVGNTVIGALLALGGLVGGLLALLSIPATIALLAGAAFLGFVLSARLPGVSRR